VFVALAPARISPRVSSPRTLVSQIYHPCFLCCLACYPLPLLSVAPTRFLIFRSLQSPSSPSRLSRSPIRSLARTLADPQSTGVVAGMPNVGLWVYIDLRVCTRAGAATETAQVKVAESAGQHESTGNVSRELGVGVTAASV